MFTSATVYKPRRELQIEDIKINPVPTFTKVTHDGKYDKDIRSRTRKENEAFPELSKIL